MHPTAREGMLAFMDKPDKKSSQKGQLASSYDVKL